MQGKSRDLSDVIQFHAHQLPAQLSQSTNCSISKFHFSTFHHAFAFQSKHSLWPNVPCSVVNTSKPCCSRNPSCRYYVIKADPRWSQLPIPAIRVSLWGRLAIHERVGGSFRQWRRVSCLALLHPDFRPRPMIRPQVRPAQLMLGPLSVAEAW